MNKIKYKSISILIFLLINIMACLALPLPVEISREYIGKIIDVNVMPTSFMDYSLFKEFIKIQIKTEYGFFVLYNISFIRLGAKAYIITYNDDKRYFTWNGTNKKYYVPEK